MNKKKNIIFWTLFGIIFLSLVLIATFFDYDISKILASNGLKNGEYYSYNIFGRIFEVIGEMPLYLFLSFACGIIALNFIKAKNKGLKYTFFTLFSIFGIVSSFVAWFKMGNYIYKLNPTIELFNNNVWMILLYISLSILIQLLIEYFINRYLDNNLNNLLPFAILILLTAGIAQGIVQGIKPIFARERFRSIYFLDYRNIESIGFTKWFMINGSAKELASQANVASTYFASFPSGHTCGAGITYTLMFLPFYLKSLDNKKSRIICLLIPIFVTGLVGFARIVMGAHYMSDVLFGGTFSFIASIISYYIANAINKKIKA